MKKVFTKKFVKKAVLALLIIALIIPQSACKSNGQNAASNQGISKTGFFLDTVCSITIYGLADQDGKLADMTDEELEKECYLIITDAFKLCSEYENMLSKTIETSDIARINNAEGKAVTVSDETIEVLKKGLEFGRLSGGAFDITIGKATDLWDFHDNAETGHEGGIVPSEEALKEAISHVNYENIKIEGNRASLTDPKTEINLGGIAKGYIADKAAEYLEERGVVSAIVDLGGNIVAIGGKTSQIVASGDTQEADFKIGIKDPLSTSGSLLELIPCKNKTVVTSGTYERYFEKDGVKYHHILDVNTGYPVDTDVLSVTIIADRGKSADCDGLSTTCLALGMEKGMELVKSLEGFEAVFVDKDGNVEISSDNIKFN
ncbi:MAG: FAD:protein FMN transferase [Anaerovoracaceae bacterium]